MIHQLVFLCITVAACLAVAYPEESIDFENFVHQLNPHPSNISLCNSRIRAMRQATASASPSPAAEICLKKAKSSIFVFGKCPKKCYKSLSDGFLACGPRIQFGCELKLVKPTKKCESGIRCELNPEIIKEDNTICPGDKVVFNKINIKKLENLSYGVDLTANPVETDFYMLFDATGSMGRSIDSAKANATKILNVFGTRPNVAFGVGFYRDDVEPGLPLGGFVNVQGITPIRNKKGDPIESGEDKIRDAIDGLVATGGGDGDEANLVALYKVATDPSIGWRKNSRKIIVKFGDWPGHEPTCVLPGLTLTRTNVVAALNALKITVIVVDFFDLDRAPSAFRCPGSSPAGTGQGSFIASNTGGYRVTGRDRTSLCEAITDGLENLKKTFDVDETECAPYLDSKHDPSLPVELSPGESTFVENTFKILPSICDGGSKFTCRYKYTESGASLPDINVEFVKIKGC